MMNWKVFFTTFGLVFLAELGDKTQLASLNLAAKSKMPFSVFLGSTVAYILVTLITVIIGDKVSNFLAPEYIKYGSAFVFILIGIFIITGKI